jgi:hypothetical protein
VRLRPEPPARLGASGEVPAYTRVDPAIFRILVHISKVLEQILIDSRP